jgi:hypothetical protein
MESVRANDDFIGMTHILLKFVGPQHDIHENIMGFIKIDDFHSGFSERECRVG